MTLLLFALIAFSGFGMLYLQRGWRNASAGPALLYGIAMFYSLLFDVLDPYVQENKAIIMCMLLVIMSAAALVHNPAGAAGVLLNKNVLAWSAFFIYCGLSLVWTSNMDYGAWKMRGMLVHSILPGFLILFASRVGKNLEWNTLVVVGVMYSAYIAFAGTWDSSARLSLQTGNPIWVARDMWVLTLVIIGSRSRHRSIWMIMAAAPVVIALLTQSKGPFLAFVLALILYWYKSTGAGASLGRLARTAYLASFAVLIAMVAVYAAGWWDVIGGSRFGSMLDRDQAMMDVTILDRLALQANAVDGFVNHFFFGTGLGGLAPIGKREYPHQIFLEVAGELGIVGLCLFGYALARTVWSAGWSVPLLAALGIFGFACAQFSGDLAFNGALFLTAFLIIGVGMRDSGLSRRPPQIKVNPHRVDLMHAPGVSL